jgi:hypothetical protein
VVFLVLEKGYNNGKLVEMIPFSLQKFGHKMNNAVKTNPTTVNMSMKNGRSRVRLLKRGTVVVVEPVV